jgi:excisionase family DNA binding protein
LELMHTKEAAEFLHRSPGAIRNLVMRRAIPHRKAGGRLVFLKDEIERWIEKSPGIKLNDLERERS